MRPFDPRNNAVRAEALPQALWDQASEFIATRMGLHFPPERRDDLQRAFQEAAAGFGLADANACAEWLLNTPITAAEQRKLVTYLTIGETYFFRERPSFNALATQVLPVLIHRKRATGKRLRIWSAACSTGEEAYSLSILIQQVLPDWRDWDVQILATDINQKSLSKAATGVYGEWSFRESPPEFRDHYFTMSGDRQYRVRPVVRELVTFAELNLALNLLPSVEPDTRAMDLILCRNLLIYFTPTHARRLIAGLRNSLIDDGWLIVSPSECSQALFKGFVPVNFPGSILYRKRTALAPDRFLEQPSPEQPFDSRTPQALTPVTLTPTAVAQMLTQTLPPKELPKADPDAGTIHSARELYELGHYGDAVKLLREALDASETAESNPQVFGLLSRSLANLGKSDAALAASERWIAADKLDPSAHYLHAMVLQELGERSSARAALNRAIYLMPDFTLAHFALGNLARAEARHADARRHFDNAAHLLRGYQSDETLPESEGLTAGRLREIISSLSAFGAES
jgi:chemotaxis protein methyltransferase CheR